MLVAASASSLLLEPHVLPVRPVPPGALKPQAPTVGRGRLREATPVASVGHLRHIKAWNATVSLPVLDVHLSERDVPPRNPRSLVPGSEERRQHEVRDLQISRRELTPRTHPPEQRFRRLRRTTFRLRLAHIPLRRDYIDQNNPLAPLQALPGATPHLQSCTKSSTLSRHTGKNFEKLRFWPLSPVQPTSPSTNTPKCPQNARKRPKNRNVETPRLPTSFLPIYLPPPAPLLSITL